MKKVVELASIFYDNLVTKERENGESFIVLSDDAPSWARPILMNALQGFIDDHRYEYIDTVAGIIADAPEDSTEDDLRELTDRLEADVYSSDLLKWISSDLHRAEYVNDAAKEGLVSTEDFSLFDALRAGQYEEMREVFNYVLDGLIEQAKEMVEEEA